jgi:hypothetical protein
MVLLMSVAVFNNEQPLADLPSYSVHPGNLYSTIRCKLRQTETSLRTLPVLTRLTSTSFGQNVGIT